MNTEITHTNGLYVQSTSKINDDALSAWWQGRASTVQLGQVHTLLQGMHINRHWLRCLCRSSSEKAYLAPVKLNESYHLKRLTKRAEHDQRCLFWNEAVEASADKPIKPSNTGNDFDPVWPSFLQTETGNTVSNRQTQQQQSSKNQTDTPRIPKLASRMFWLAHVAGTQSTPLKTPVSAWLKVVKTVLVAPGVPLHKIFFLKSKVWTDKWADSAFKSCENNHLAPVCWWVTVITSYNDKTRRVTFADSAVLPETISLSADVKVHAGDCSPARFPMLAILKLGITNQQVGIQGMYAHPIVGVEDWMLVDSNLERKTHANLAEVCLWLKQKHQQKVTIEKPVFNWQNAGERPDFVLTHHGRQSDKYFVVETMGYQNPEYLQRKSQMEKNLKVKMFFDLRSETDLYSKEIFNAVARWALQAG